MAFTLSKSQDLQASKKIWFGIYGSGGAPTTPDASGTRALAEVAGVFDVFLNAAAAGELDAATAKATAREPRLKPGAAKASANA